MNVRAPSQLVDDLVRIRGWSQRAQGQDIAEVDTINVIIGDGVTPLTPGVASVIRVDFRARITGCFLQEFDGNSGSIAVDIQKAQGGGSPAWVRISPPAGPAIVTGRYFEDPSACTTWPDQSIDRGDYLRYVVTGASAILRVHVGLRIRRLEP